MTSKDLSVVKLLWEILNRKTGEIGSVNYFPQKTQFNAEAPVLQAFERSTPEEQGISSVFLASLLRALKSADKIHMHQIMVIRHDKVILECGFAPCPTGFRHVTYSMCKSFTGMAVGLLVGDGKLHLDDRLIDYLDPLNVSISNPLHLLHFREITIGMLLTMSSGVSFNEAGAVSGNNWIHSYTEAPLNFDPGSTFEYNSMNSYMLSAVVQKITGMTMYEFLKKRLFEPMGISEVFWESSPEGITKGGWGMFIRPEDACKLASLYMHGGIWNGTRLISEEWIRQSTSVQINTGMQDNPGYGYHIWADRRPGSYFFNGMLGQNVHCFPDADMIVLTNAGNEELFQAGQMTQTFWSYFGDSFRPSESPLPRDPSGLRLLAAAVNEVSGGNIKNPVTGWQFRRLPGTGKKVRTPLPKQMTRIPSSVLGCSFRLQDPGIGLFPLIMQVIHNNYTHGITDVRFLAEGPGYLLEFTEGNTILKIPFSPGESRLSEIVMNGEPYSIGTRAHFSMDEENRPVLTIRLVFLEEASERLIRFRFLDRNTMDLRFSETPGNEIINRALKSVTLDGTGKGGFFMQAVSENISPVLLRQCIASALSPEVIAERYDPAEEYQKENVNESTD